MSSGTDGISVCLLKEGVIALTDKLLFIFNLSISTGVVPNCWKTKRVSPIYKTGNKMNLVTTDQSLLPPPL